MYILINHSSHLILFQSIKCAMEADQGDKPYYKKDCLNSKEPKLCETVESRKKPVIYYEQNDQDLQIDESFDSELFSEAKEEHNDSVLSESGNSKQKTQYFKYKNKRLSKTEIEVFQLFFNLSDDPPKMFEQIAKQKSLKTVQIHKIYKKFVSLNITQIVLKDLKPILSKGETGYRKTALLDEAINSILKQNPLTTVHFLIKSITNKIGIEISKETVIRRLKKLKYVYQRFVIKKQSKHTKVQTKVRQLFVQIISQLQEKQVYYYSYCYFALDEFKPNMWMKTDQCEQFFENIHKRQRQLVILTLFLSVKRVAFSKIYTGIYQDSMFLQSLQEFAKDQFKIRSQRKHMKIQPNEVIKAKLVELRPLEDVFIVYEPAKQVFQKKNNAEHPKLRSILEEYQLQKILFPMHSSEMHPADILFNTIKFGMREMRPQNLQKMIDSIQKVIKNKIDKSDIEFSFTHAFNNLHKACQPDFTGFK